MYDDVVNRTYSNIGWFTFLGIQFFQIGINMCGIGFILVKIAFMETFANTKKILRTLAFKILLYPVVQIVTTVPFGVCFVLWGSPAINQKLEVLLYLLATFVYTTHGLGNFIVFLVVQKGAWNQAKRILYYFFSAAAAAAAAIGPISSSSLDSLAAGAGGSPSSKKSKSIVSKTNDYYYKSTTDTAGTCTAGLKSFSHDADDLSAAAAAEEEEEEEDQEDQDENELVKRYLRLVDCNRNTNSSDNAADDATCTTTTSKVGTGGGDTGSSLSKITSSLSQIFARKISYVLSRIDEEGSCDGSSSNVNGSCSLVGSAPSSPTKPTRGRGAEVSSSSSSSSSRRSEVQYEGPIDVLRKEEEGKMIWKEGNGSSSSSSSGAADMMVVDMESQFVGQKLAAADCCLTD